MKIEYDKDNGITLYAETLREAFEIGSTMQHVNRPSYVNVYLSTQAGSTDGSKVGLHINKAALNESAEIE